MDPSPVSGSTAQPIQSIYLLHQLSLPYSSQRRVTGQGTWGRGESSLWTKCEKSSQSNTYKKKKLSRWTDEALPLTDGVYFLCDQERLSSHSGCRRRRLGPCVTPTHDNDIVLLSGKATGTSGNQYQETLQAGELLCQHVRCTPAEGELHGQRCGRDDFF